MATHNEQLPVREARAGSSEAWDTLLARYRLPLYAYVFQLIHQEQASLDIVQETFINAARHLAGLRDDAKFGSWLFNIAHQKCVQHWRKKWPDEIGIDDEDREFVDDKFGPDELLIREEQEQEFMKLLDQLALPQRSVLLLHFVEEFSVAEIAEVIGVPIGTVKSRLHYARKAFKKLFKEYRT